MQLAPESIRFHTQADQIVRVEQVKRLLFG
jgi:hypothetical protein